MVASEWLTVILKLLNRKTLSTEEFRDNLRLHFGLHPKGLIQTCDGCGGKLTVDHALQCKMGGLVTTHHIVVAYEWGPLCASALTLLYVDHKTLINDGG